MFALIALRNLQQTLERLAELKHPHEKGGNIANRKKPKDQQKHHFSSAQRFSINRNWH